MYVTMPAFLLRSMGVNNDLKPERIISETRINVKWAQFWGGYDLTFERVETAAAMKAALGQQTWDVVISDSPCRASAGLPR